MIYLPDASHFYSYPKTKTTNQPSEIQTFAVAFWQYILGSTGVGNIFGIPVALPELLRYNMESLSEHLTSYFKQLSCDR